MPALLRGIATVSIPIEYTFVLYSVLEMPALLRGIATAILENSRTAFLFLGQ